MNKNNQSPLAKRRTELNMSQFELARKLELGSNTISRIETGNCSVPESIMNLYADVLMIELIQLRELFKETHHWREEKDADERLINRSLRYI